MREQQHDAHIRTWQAEMRKLRAKDLGGFCVLRYTSAHFGDGGRKVRSRIHVWMPDKRETRCGLTMDYAGDPYRASETEEHDLRSRDAVFCERCFGKNWRPLLPQAAPAHNASGIRGILDWEAKKNETGPA